MLQPSVKIACLSVAFFFTATISAHPNDSIGRERIPPTPHGERLVRTDHYLIPSTPMWNAASENMRADGGDALRAKLADLEHTEAVTGAYASARVEPLESVGRGYLASGDYRRAMEYFRRALHLARVNDGLYAASQLPILKNMWASEMAMGDLDAADKIRHYRYRVQQQAFASDRQAMFAATEEYTEWQKELYLAGFGDDTFRRLLRMHSLRTDIIEELEAEEDFQPELISHLYERMASEYLLADYSGEKQPLVQINIASGPQLGPSLSTDLERQEFKMIRNNCFRNGVNTLRKVIELLKAQEPQQVEELARAKIALGDWYQWWDWKSRAMENYREAYALYAQDSSPVTNPQQLFTEPVELPEEPIFQPALAKTDDFSSARARVSLTVSKLGRAREIEILELEPAGSMGARVTLFNMLREIRFRPLVVDGRVVASSPMVREYNFTY